MQGAKIAKIILEEEKKKEQEKRLVLPDIKTYFIAIIITIVWHRHIDMWDRIELSNCLVQCRKFIHDQVDVTNQWSVDKLISNGAGITGYLYGEKLDFIFTSNMKINWILKNLNLKCKTLKFLEENKGEWLYDLCVEKISLKRLLPS